MNIAELQQFRKYRESEISLDIIKTKLHWAVAERHEESLKNLDELFELYNKDKSALVALHLSQLRAAHRMMQGLMTAPRSEALGDMSIEWPYGHFSVKERTVWTPEAGEFVVNARVWRNHRITSADTSLTLAYQHSQGAHPNFPKSGRTEDIISTQADELEFEGHQYISWSEPIQSAIKRETVAVVCSQVGVEVVEA